MKFYCKPVFIYLLGFYIMVCLFSSCSEQRRTTVKSYVPHKPFVFNNKIVLQPGLSKDAKKKLSLDLINYWDDSLQARKVQQFGLFYKLKNPPLFDSANIPRTKKFMNAYLRSQGYYYADFKDTFYVDSSYKDQMRTTVVMTIQPGKNTLIDSVANDFTDSTLQKIAQLQRKQSLLKVKKPYSKELISSELDRLVGLFRDSGYYQFTRDNIYAEVDTTDAELLQLTLDPFEQARRITEAAERRKKNPTIDVFLMQRPVSDSVPGTDSAKYKQYYVGNIYYYPEMRYEVPDTLINNRKGLKYYTANKDTVYFKEGKFLYRPLREHTFLRTGSHYNESYYFKTINNFSQIGAWQQVDTRSVIRADTVDFHIFLTPAVKQNVTVDLEASRNSGDFITTGNLFGLALNTTYRNRNLWKRAIQSTTSFRNGIELSFNKENSLLQTVQSSLVHTYIFPRFIIPFVKTKGRYKLDGVKTLFSVSGSYSDRKDFFRLRSLVASWGYEWRKKNAVWQYKPLNIELYSLDTLDQLRAAFITNPFLRSSFNTGSVVSQQLSYNITYAGARPNISNYLRISAEEAGGILGRIKSLQDKIYQYIKLEIEFRKDIQFRKTSLAMRAFAGAGYNYGDEAKFGKTLPFFKQFVGGGPYSMRAWSLRQIGLGSSLLSDTAGTKDNAFRDRYGDMQLEFNLEYRYNIAEIGSMKIGSALFTDIGNIWNIKKDPNNPNSEFNLSRLGKDMAIGVGTGLRFDFSYFLIRLDFGLKLKDPTKMANNGWLNINDFTWKNYEFERKDSSGNVISPNRNNYAIQLGIGLPF